MKASLLLFALCAALPGAAKAAGWYAEAAAENIDVGSAAFGYEFASGLGIEAGYRRTDEGRQFGRRLDDVDGAEVAVRGVVRLRPRFALTGRLGLFEWNGETLRFDPATHQVHIDEKESVSPIVGAGVRFDMTEHFALTGELTYTDPHKMGLEHSIRALVGLRASF